MQYLYNHKNWNFKYSGRIFQLQGWHDVSMDVSTVNTYNKMNIKSKLLLKQMGLLHIIIAFPS